MKTFYRKELLLAPGPTPLHPEVLKAMISPMISHRTQSFQDLYKEIEEYLKELMHTKNQILLIPSSGTGGLQAAVKGCLSMGEKIVVASNGHFADLFSRLAASNGMNVVDVPFPWGQPVDPFVIAASVKEHKDAKALLLIQNETSTGVLSDIKTIVTEIRKVNKEILIFVDAVSSLGGTEFRLDEWGVDVVVSSSQKALMAPPGLCIMSLSDRAWAAAETVTCLDYYFDIKRIRKEANRHMTLTTPAVSIFFALRKSLEIIFNEGMKNCFGHNKALQEMIFELSQSTGVTPLGRLPYASPTVTALVVPEACDPEMIRNELYKKYSIVSGPGLGKIASKTFRIGHMGYVDRNDIQMFFNSLTEIISGPRARRPK
ncbi:pyridoxal-phosphate-dependent aminotransferase family protein [Sediminispirochaeta smaragdinae]|uniref:Aminotransferase class V n=1 Tax=Sediminispirochaeta smaragdinae (strain DSM 11293 / JCM 15392 / SEBR 4228) TaxID=573413 RepID=E1RC53_SEDSS|nr:alanine--glyoxylate aminotransferase family protein [Sediminispirochaeta smaragdinae]ADK79933.1 aminotransferase class V [Sediminispirochaeta smaragdinae DSM 11293]